MTTADVPRTRRPDHQHRYLVAIGAHTAVVAGLAATGARRSTVVPTAMDVFIGGLATQKLSRLISKEVVTTPLRAPFTEVVGPGGPGEIQERPVEAGWRTTVGELLTCPFCLDVWTATAVTTAIAFAPRLGRTLAAGAAVVAVADFAQLVYATAQRAAEGPSDLEKAVGAVGLQRPQRES